MKGSKKMSAQEKHFVTFHSPGTFFDECSSRDVSAWNTMEATEIARSIVERHGAKPFAFSFGTRLVADPIDDGRGGVLQVQPREIQASGLYYLGGEIKDYDEIAASEPDSKIMLSNMRCNDLPIVIVNTNSFKTVRPFREQDQVVDTNGVVVRRGDDPTLVEKRRMFIERWQAEE